MRAPPFGLPRPGTDLNRQVSAALWWRVQSSVTSLIRGLHETDTGQWALRIGRGPDWVDTALATVFMYFWEIANVAYQAFDLTNTGLAELGTKFHELSASEKTSGHSG